MRVLLINSGLMESGTYKSFSPPLGILYIAAMLKQNSHNVEVIDCDCEPNGYETICRTLICFSPDYVGISSVTETFENALNIAKFCKSIKNQVRIVLGGVHATVFPEKILSLYSFVDYIIAGDGESSMLKLVEQRTPLSDIKGLSYREGNSIRVSAMLAAPDDLDALPFPERRLVEKYSYTYKAEIFSFNRVGALFGKKKPRTASIISSRGCPSKCRFCANSAFRRGKIRYRSVDNIMGEIDSLVADGYRRFIFMDDHFTSSPTRILELCRLLKKHHDIHGIQWVCFGRVDTASRSLFKAMSEAGCREIYFGMESASGKIMNYYKKGIDLKKVREAVRWAKLYSIDVVISLIVGAPIESWEDIHTTSNFVNELDVDFLDISKLTVLPGTELWEDYVREGNIDPDRDWSRLLFIHDIDENVTKSDLRKNARYIMRRFYLRPQYLLRQLPRLLARVSQ